MCAAISTNYRLTEPARDLDRFVDDLSNWYVRRCRNRFWASGMEQDKVDAFMTLYTVLETLCRLAAPFTPFMTEAMYQNIVRSVDKDAPESVHLGCLSCRRRERSIDAELRAEHGYAVLESWSCWGAAHETQRLSKIASPLQTCMCRASMRSWRYVSQS